MEHTIHGKLKLFLDHNCADTKDYFCLWTSILNHRFGPSKRITKNLSKVNIISQKNPYSSTLHSKNPSILLPSKWSSFFGFSAQDLFAHRIVAGSSRFNQLLILPHLSLFYSQKHGLIWHLTSSGYFSHLIDFHHERHTSITNQIADTWNAFCLLWRHSFFSTGTFSSFFGWLFLCSKDCISCYCPLFAPKGPDSVLSGTAALPFKERKSPLEVQTHTTFERRREREWKRILGDAKNTVRSFFQWTGVWLQVSFG